MTAAQRRAAAEAAKAEILRSWPSMASVHWRDADRRPPRELVSRAWADAGRAEYYAGCPRRGPAMANRLAETMERLGLAGGGR